MLASFRSLMLASRHGLGVIVGGPSLVDRSRTSHESLARYRADFQPSAFTQDPRAIVAINGAVADSADRARDLLLPQIWAEVKSRSTGSFEALEHVTDLDVTTLTERERNRVNELFDLSIHGTPRQVREQLDDLFRYAGVDEVLVIDDGSTDRTAQIAKFQVEWHRKLMLAFACVVFFFIGAPLGAIVGKGGMGLPAVIAILFFLVFHILSYSTEQMVKAGTLGPWPGMWISTFVLLPIGMFLTWKAAVESPLFDRVAYDRAWKRFRSLLAPRHAHPPTVQ